MRLRVVIQKVEFGKYTHIHNIALESEDLTKVITACREALKEEIMKRKELLDAWLRSRVPTFIEDIIKNTPEDLIDWGAKGKDISKKEYLENEYLFDLMESQNDR